MTTLHKTSQEELRRLVDQIERLEEEKAGITADIKDKMEEAKGLGFDPKILKRVLALRKKDQAEVSEEQALIDTYMHALSGDDTPLGKHWAEKREDAHA